MKHNPKISVIIPVYNVEKYLGRCIRSILNQTLTDLEIIIINDGSTDSSPEIIKKYAKKDQRIKIINQKNVGLSSTRNNGLKIAKGEYITFVDSDDFIENKKAYKKMLSTAEKYSSEIVIGNFNFVNEKNEKWSRFNDYLFQDKNNFNKKSFLVNKTFFYDSLSQGVWNKLYKRSFLEKHNLKFPDGIIFEDTPFSLRVISLSKKISVIPDIVYDYYIGRKDSLSRKKGIKQLDFLKSSQLVKTNIHTLGLYKKYFPHFIWVILPLHQFKIIEQKYQKKFFDILNKNITKEDFKNILMYGNKEQIDFATALINNQYYKYILKEKILSFKNKIKDKTKRFLCKINPVYRYVSKIKDSNEQIIKSIYTTNEKIDTNKLIYKNILIKEDQIKLNLAELNLEIHSIKQCQNEISLKFESIQSNNRVEEKLNIIEEKNSYIENLIKTTTDITQIPKATGVLRKLQEKSKLLLKEFDRVCRKNNLKYWLDGGTLLGAIRHNGFIPWDDDLDVSMMVEDYEKFCLIAKKEFKESCALFKKVPSQIIKITHKDFTPSSDKEWADFIFWRLEDKISFALDVFPFYYLKNDIKINEASSIIRDNCDFIKDIHKKFSGYNDFKKIEKIINKNNIKISSKIKTNNIYLGLETLSNQPVIRNYDDIFPIKETYFEGMKVYIPNNVDAILNSLYGDFMKFPKDIYPAHLNVKNFSKEEILKLNK